MRIGCFLAVLFWPTVCLNGALWGQCDSIYVAFALLGIWLALEDKPIFSMVMMTLSFAFKLQAVFLLPICAVLWIYGKYNWKHFLVFPLTYVLLVLPAVLLGRPFWDTITLYFHQTGSVGDGLNYNSPSIFAIFWNVPEDRTESISRIAICAAGLYLVNLLALAWIKRKRLNDRAVICLALLMAIGVPFLLPHMHDRYFYPADALSLVLAFGMPSLFLTAPLVEFGSFLGYYAYLSFYFSEKGGHFLLFMYYGAYALIAALVLTGIGFAWSTASSASGKRASPAKRKKA
jgi:Gpi18-like mannosyltransferase